MAGNHLQGCKITPQHLSGSLSAVLVIDSVKSIAANPLLEPRVRAGVDFGVVGQGAVETGVENGDLRCAGEELCGEVDAVQPSPIVQRGDGSHVRNGLSNLGSDASRFG